ncbi:hypothetical protein O9K51_07270 [Purpureocillium lavendulum]|uniref:Xylanolytic transcriptional activator regulatory domain-containing protein n=1 Tax=Purpureocillium lavendulum TaxID=1247861 RepID=A0AB34FKC7_9HYPO|nr:hypothetical protein O9K51_07270 [Purpureocillium lavendulum]
MAPSALEASAVASCIQGDFTRIQAGPAPDAHGRFTCSGARPKCHRCSTKDLPCEYDVQPNQTRAASRRESEEQLRELYSHLHSRPWEEAVEILRRIRETADALEVARLVRAGDLLLKRSLPDEGSDAIDGPRGASAASPGRAPFSIVSPWTTVTDRDTVYSLINIFFERDQRFLMPFVDRDMFLRDIQLPPKPGQNGRFCSALLVNAICAITACRGTLSTSDRSSRRGLDELFFVEAKRHLDFENGRPSIPAVQALLIMFSYSCRMGQDRIGTMFRALGYEMMERMTPRIKGALSNDDLLAIKHACDLSEVLNKVLSEARRLGGGEGTDDTSVSQLAELYQTLQELQAGYPQEDECQGPHDREYCHLWAYYHLVAAHITQLLRHIKALSPLQENPTVMCIRHCQGIIRHVDRHFARYPSDRQGSLAALYFAYTCTIFLVDLIHGESPEVVETFSRGCQIFHEATDFPLAGLLLDGLAAVADHMGVQLPSDVAPYFGDLKVTRPELVDVPLGFVVPFRGRHAQSDGQDIGWDTELTGLELGDLLGRRTATGPG